VLSQGEQCDAFWPKFKVSEEIATDNVLNIVFFGYIA